MIRKGLYIIFLLLLTGANKLEAQPNLTGTWEGIMSKTFFPRNEGQLLQLNIIQQNGQLCGYTYDTVIGHHVDYCKALFTGKYDKWADLWVLTGTSFIENSGDHVLMRIRLWKKWWSKKDMLEAEMSLASDPDPDLSTRLPTIFNSLNNIEFGMDIPQRSNATENFELKRVSKNIPKMPDKVPPCFPLAKIDSPITETIVKKSLPVKDITWSKKDSLTNIIYPSPIVAQNDTPQILQKMTGRKKITFSRLPVDVKHITLKIYDNAIVDDDTITVFYNTKLLINKQRISEKPIVLEIELDEKEPHHEIILFADNLGSIPPNTALIVVTAGDKRYEIHSSANLDENAVLVFDYTPK